LISRQEAAPTQGLSNETWTFQISRFFFLEFEMLILGKSYVKGGLPILTPVGCTYKILA
jgi:hypothetical protein